MSKKHKPELIERAFNFKNLEARAAEDEESGGIIEGRAVVYNSRTDLGYFNVICNFVQVIRGTEEPRYIQSVKCSNCGYKEESEDNSHLKYFEVTKNVSKKN